MIKNKPCEWHRPFTVDLGNMKRQHWAAERIMKGEKAKKCEYCGCWFYKDEYGEKPKG
jgi:hypothetical protein